MQSALTMLLQLHGRIASDTPGQFASVDEAVASLPTSAEVHQEAARLHALIESAHSKRSRADRIPDSAGISMDAYNAYLDEISALLEAAPDEKAKRDIVDKLLQEEQSSASRVNVDVDVRAEVARAWSMDQQAILQAREQTTDRVSIGNSHNR